MGPSQNVKSGIPRGTRKIKSLATTQQYTRRNLSESAAQEEVVYSQLQEDNWHLIAFGLTVGA